MLSVLKMTLGELDMLAQFILFIPKDKMFVAQLVSDACLVMACPAAHVTWVITKVFCWSGWRVTAAVVGVFLWILRSC